MNLPTEIRIENLKNVIREEIEWSRSHNITDAEIASVIADIHLDLMNRIYLDKHYNGDTPPRLEVRQV